MAIQLLEQTHPGMCRLVRIPFFLEPDYNAEDGSFWESHYDRMTRKFGSREEFEKVKLSHRLVERAAEVGIDESIGFSQSTLDNRRQSSTLRSHRLVQYVFRNHSPLLSEKLYAVLNRKHFIENAILNDVDTLLDACCEIGLNKLECKLFLESNNLEDYVTNTVNHVHSLGIHSIPTIIVDGQYMLSGAVSSQEVFAVLRKIADCPSGRRVFA
jgi:predicted DsbA family dithiol-disulfide isomerase